MPSDMRARDTDFYSNDTLKLDRQHMLWFNKYYSKVTSKGNVVGWYLDPPAHEPYWHNRKAKFIRDPRRKTQHISSKTKEKYQKLLLGRISTDCHLTAGELNAVKLIFATPPEVPAEVSKPRLNSKEQLDLQNILNSIKNPGRLPTPPEEGEIVDEPKGDDAAATAFAYAEHQKRMDAVRNMRSGKMGKKAVKVKDEFEDMWQGREEERYLEGT